jgi:hypothetical protein
MREILPGVFHWTSYHEGIQQYVHSYYVMATNPAILIDPRVPTQGLRWFTEAEVPQHIYLTNRHHYRHSDRFAEHLGSTVWCHKAGLHEFTRGEKVKPFHHGDELPGGVLALKVGVLCPEETALYIPRSGGILAIGDAIIRKDGKLSFVPDELMGDNPEAVKQGLRKIFLHHLDRDFDHLLFAHGAPLLGGAKARLRRFIREMPS